MILDDRRLALTQGDCWVPLSRIEYLMARHLHGMKGDFAKWDDLIEAVYDANYEPDLAKDSLSVTLHNLKKKLKRNGLPMPIEVRWRRGVRWAAS